MNIIRKMILFIKNIFVKQEEIKALEEPKQIINQEKKINFVESLKITTTEKKNKKRIETLTCEGDGLGIQKKISC
ncbi:MAG: hypothetical protein HFJ52_07190 [Clostridia bacterium]|nr:hypothetical protein [Clostridia bacterium]